MCSMKTILALDDGLGQHNVGPGVSAGMVCISFTIRAQFDGQICCFFTFGAVPIAKVHADYATSPLGHSESRCQTASAHPRNP